MKYIPYFLLFNILNISLKEIKVNLNILCFRLFELKIINMLFCWSVLFILSRNPIEIYID